MTYQGWSHEVGKANDKNLSGPDLHAQIHAFHLIWLHSLKLAFHLLRQQIITQSANSCTVQEFVQHRAPNQLWNQITVDFSDTEIGLLIN